MINEDIISQVEERLGVLTEAMQYFVTRSISSASTKIKIMTQEELRSIRLQTHGESQDNSFLQALSNPILSTLSYLCDLQISTPKDKTTFRTKYKDGEMVSHTTIPCSDAKTVMSISNMRVFSNEEEKQIYYHRSISRIKWFCSCYFVHLRGIRFQIEIERKYCLTSRQESRKGELQELYRVFSTVFEVKLLDILSLLMKSNSVRIKMVITKLFTTNKIKQMCFINDALVRSHPLIDCLAGVYARCYQSFQKRNYGFYAYIDIKHSSSLDLESININSFSSHIQSKLVKREQIKVFNYQRMSDCITVPVSILNKVHSIINPHSKLQLCIETKTKHQHIQSPPSSNIQLVASNKPFRVESALNPSRKQTKPSSPFGEFLYESELISHHTNTKVIVLHRDSLYSIDLEQIMHQIFLKHCLSKGILYSMSLVHPLSLKQILGSSKQSTGLSMQECMDTLIQYREHILKITRFSIDGKGILHTMTSIHRGVNSSDTRLIGQLLIEISREIIKYGSLDRHRFIKYYCKYMLSVYATSEMGKEEQRAVYSEIVSPVLSKRFDTNHVFARKWKEQLLDMGDVLKQFDRC